MACKWFKWLKFNQEDGNFVRFAEGLGVDLIHFRPKNIMTSQTSDQSEAAFPNMEWTGSFGIGVKACTCNLLSYELGYFS